MARFGWYVVQVQTGREQAMCEVIRRVCAEDQTDGLSDAPLLEECFSPTYVHRLKYRGEWRDVERHLLPGYVVAVTSDPAKLARKLLGVRDFTRLLTITETFVPLREEERAWIDENTKAGERVIPISVGYRRGDTLVVTNGPLAGHEAMVDRVIRKKCVAVLKVHVGNKTVMTEVGLALLPEREAELASVSEPHDEEGDSETAAG